MLISQRSVTTGIASLAIIVSLASFWFRSRTPRGQIDPAANELAIRAGELVAEETVQTIQDRGRIVLVTDHEDLRSATFRNELKKHSSISILTTEILHPEALERTVFSAATFKRMMEQYGQADAVVFLTGLPEWSKVEPLISGETAIPKIIVLDSMEGFFLKKHYNGYFVRGILSVLIAHRSDATPSDPHRAPGKWFSEHYQVYTAENYDSLIDVDLSPARRRSPP